MTDVTVNRGYPFPECDPPLVKDASDAPMDTRDLAEAIDADLTVYSDLVDFRYKRVTATMRLAAITLISTVGDFLPFDTLEYDPTGGDIADTANDAFVIPTDGLYVWTIFVTTADAANKLSTQVVVNGVNGQITGLAANQGAGPNMTSSMFPAIYSAGDVIKWRLKWVTGTINVQARAGLTRLVGF